MNLENANTSESYDGLKTQFFALKRMLQCKEAEIGVYHKMMKKFSLEKIIKLEAELEFQKEMNAILTEELDKYIQTT